MNKKDFITEINFIVGNDYNSNYFKYLLYSYNLSLNEGKLIIEEITDGFDGRDVNVISLIEDSFRKKIIDLEKKDKINYLNDLISYDNEFFITYLEDCNLSDNFIQLVYEKIENEINEDNIDYFMIKRNLKDYFRNKKFYHTYMRRLNEIKGRKYNSLIIKKALKNYNNLSIDDIKITIHEMEKEIIDGETYNDNFRKAFDNKLNSMSEKKKADARSNFNYLLDDYGDAFISILEKNKLTWDDGQLIIKTINKSIDNGELQPEEINGGFIFYFIKNWDVGV